MRGLGQRTRRQVHRRHSSCVRVRDADGEPWAESAETAIAGMTAGDLVVCRSSEVDGCALESTKEPYGRDGIGRVRQTNWTLALVRQTMEMSSREETVVEATSCTEVMAGHTLHLLLQGRRSTSEDDSISIASYLHGTGREH